MTSMRIISCLLLVILLRKISCDEDIEFVAGEPEVVSVKNLILPEDVSAQSIGPQVVSGENPVDIVVEETIEEESPKIPVGRVQPEVVIDPNSMVTKVHSPMERQENDEDTSPDVSLPWDLAEKPEVTPSSSEDKNKILWMVIGMLGIIIVLLFIVYLILVMKKKPIPQVITVPGAQPEAVVTQANPSPVISAATGSVSDASNPPA